MSNIFISYRRQDAAAWAGRLHDDLARQVGSERVFSDVENIEVGSDFAQAMHAALDASDYVLVVIGPNWLGATNASGERRLDDAADPVCAEIAEALRRQKRVVPVLVGGARMPDSADLPTDLQPLTRYQGIELRDSDWQRGIERLLAVVDRSGQGAQARSAAPRWRAVGSFMSRLSAAFAVLLGRNSPHPASAPTPAAAPAAAAAVPTPAPAPPAPPAVPLDIRDVFVSHASEDHERAGAIVAAIERGGRRCWIAPRDIPSGSPSWAGVIAGALANSRLIVIVVTRHAIASKQVLREITLADSEGISLMPLRIDTAPLSPDLKFFFAAAQRLEAAAMPWDDALGQLVTAVERHLVAAGAARAAGSAA